MNDNLREQIGPILQNAYERLLEQVRQHVPAIKMEFRHSHNDVFPFRSYAQYSNASRVVIVSFDVKKTNENLRISGDISKENGFVLKDIMHGTTVAGPQEETELSTRAHEFAMKCENESILIENELRSDTAS